MIFEIKYGMGGGFGGCGDWEEIECANIEAAKEEAIERALEVYQRYEGLYGIRGMDMIMDEEGVDEEEAEDIYWNEVDSYIEYDVREKTSMPAPPQACA